MRSFYDFPMEWQRLISGMVSPTPAYAKLISEVPNPILTEFIPYRMRLAGIIKGNIEKLFYLYKGVDDETLIRSLLANSDDELKIGNSEITINGTKITDIWMIYKYSTT